MSWIGYVAIAVVNTVGVVVGIIFVPCPAVLSQYAPSQSQTDRLDIPRDESQPSILTTPTLEMTEVTPQSLEELYQLRSSISAELAEKSGPPKFDSSVAAWEYELQRQRYEALLQAQETTQARIQIEQLANQIWESALQQAIEAVTAGESNNWEQAQQHWLQAIDFLQQVPGDSFLRPSTIEKIVEYQGYLAIATYELALANQSEVQPQPLQQTVPQSQPQPQQTVANPQFSGFAMYGDSNRDGEINALDEVPPQQWSMAAGPLILFNNDDDNRDNLPDWKDLQVNGEYDAEDLALIQFKLSPEYQNTEIYITTDTETQPYINLFQKTVQGWQPVDLSGQQPLNFSDEIVLGIEAKQFAHRNWTGRVTLTATARQNGEEIASDSIQMGVAPWIMSPDTAPVTQVHLSDRNNNKELINQVKQIAEATGATTKITSGETAWMQDTTEIGYVQFPDASGIRQYPVSLKGNIIEEDQDYSQSLMSRNFGWFEMGKSRLLDPLNQWLDGYSNLAVTPPLPNYPMGRIYYGKAEDETLHPDVIDFLKAQKVQGPPIPIDTSWLMLRHVDEIISFIPSQTGEPLLLVVSPEAGIKLLEELAEKGYEGAALNRGLSTQTTVRAALNNQVLMQYNLNLQRQKVNPIIRQLQQELNLKDEQIISVPVLFGYGGYAWWPNLINSVYINGELLVSNPRGPLIDGRDYIQEDLKQRLAIAGININFLDDSYYQELKGNIQGAINTTRETTEIPFWQALPEN
ncbi:MAG: protein-arginine deiminase family protein [Microcoleaceae cyanobacterium]